MNLHMCILQFVDIISFMVFASVRQDLCPENIYDVVWAEGESDITRSQGTDLSVQQQNLHNNFIIL